MSEQIQYNYYNTLATKIGNNTFIFRGKRNSPNLVLPNSDSYVSAKLTILPNEGLIEIEHEPITNYNKRAIVRFPLKLDIDIGAKLGTSQEINLNTIISKSIRFDIDDTGDVIRLYPIENSSSVEGFCSKKDRQNLNKQISDEIDRKLDEKLDKHLRDAPHCGDCDSSGRGNGNGSGNRNGNGSGGSGLNIRPSRFVSANFIQEGFKEGASGGTDDSGCIAKISKEETELGFVFSTNPGTEKSIYHTAIMGVIWFVITFFVGRQLVDWFYKKQWMTFEPHARAGSGRYILDRNEIFVFAFLISLNIMFWGLTSYKYDKWGKHFELIAYWYTIAMFSLLYFVYDARRSITGSGISDRDKWFDPFIQWEGWKPKAVLPNLFKALMGEGPA
jgi:hypothetical protein